MTPTKQTPSECKHYVEMLGYCELRHSWSLACNLCPYEDEDCDCPDYKPKEKKDNERDNFKCTHYCEGECTLYRLSICEMAAFGDYCPDYEPSKDE